MLSKTLQYIPYLNVIVEPNEPVDKYNTYEEKNFVTCIKVNKIPYGCVL